MNPVPESGQAGAGAPGGQSNLILRILSAAVMAPVALAAAYVGGWPFAVFWTAAAVAVSWEWFTLVAGAGHRLMFSASGGAIAVAALVARLHHPVIAILLLVLGALATAIFSARSHRVWITAGTGYAGVMLLAPMLLRADDDYGFAAMVFIFGVVWTTDIFAYFAGRTFGGPKLCPAISPKKTWSGAIAGTAGAMIVGIVLARLFVLPHEIALAGIALFLSILSQMGDLLESWVKRRFGAKDASHLIPGHGGVMDRLDGFWAAALAACLIGLLRGGFDGAARGFLIW